MAFAYCMKGQALLRSGPPAVWQVLGSFWVTMYDSCLSAQHQISALLSFFHDFVTSGPSLLVISGETERLVCISLPYPLTLGPVELISFQRLWWFSVNLFSALLSVLVHFRDRAAGELWDVPVLSISIRMKQSYGRICLLT